MPYNPAADKAGLVKKTQNRSFVRRPPTDERPQAVPRPRTVTGPPTSTGGPRVATGPPTTNRPPTNVLTRPPGDGPRTITGPPTTNVTTGGPRTVTSPPVTVGSPDNPRGITITGGMNEGMNRGGPSMVGSSYGPQQGAEGAGGGGLIDLIASLGSAGRRTGNTRPMGGSVANGDPRMIFRDARFNPNTGRYEGRDENNQFPNTPAQLPRGPAGTQQDPFFGGFYVDPVTGEIVGPDGTRYSNHTVRAQYTPVTYGPTGMPVGNNPEYNDVRRATENAGDAYRDSRNTSPFSNLDPGMVDQILRMLQGNRFQGI